MLSIQPLIKKQPGIFDFFHGKIFGKLGNNGGYQLLVPQFLSSQRSIGNVAANLPARKLFPYMPDSAYFFINNTASMPGPVWVPMIGPIFVI